MLITIGILLITIGIEGSKNGKNSNLLESLIGAQLTKKMLEEVN